MSSDIGLYLHIPFCEKKCAYCDFYSAFSSEGEIDRYLGALISEIKRWGGGFCRPISSVYIGGGTPSLLGERIIPLLNAVRENFDVTPNTEITAEMNPSGDCETFLKSAKTAGVNRLSIGMQSSDNDELAVLGRRHTAEDVKETVLRAKGLGFSNISLDLMLGLPESTQEKLKKSIDFAVNCDVEHISAYILKIEPKTPFAKRQNLVLPDDDQTAEQYLFLCREMKKAGFEHYEISNFAKSGFEGRHNLKYWNCEEYIGIGPSAHSFCGGKRFYYPKDLRKFLNFPETVPDGDGGDENEKIMLALRLKNGYDFKNCPEILPFLKRLEQEGLGELKDTRFSLTDSGMLLSNSIITEILNIRY